MMDMRARETAVSTDRPPRGRCRGSVVAVMVALAGCGGGGDGTTAQTVTVHDTAAGYQVDSGIAQKGPLGRGSVVTVNELDATTLAPNGRSYTYETVDDLGTFKPSSTFASPYLETTAQGYFFNELSGERGKDWVVLRGQSYLGSGGDKAVNVNVLTAFTKERIRTLVTGPAKLGFSAARAQAQRELLAALSIHNGSDLLSGQTSGGITAPGNFMELDLSQARPADQILAMVSGLVTYVGQNGSGGGVAAFITRVGQDLADDGLLNNSTRFTPSVATELAAAQTAAPLGRVATNLNSFYGLKSPYVGTDLTQWNDSSGGIDRVIDRYKFELRNATAGTERRSPAYIAGSEDAGACVSATAGTLYRNGVKQGSAPVLIAKGDSLSLGLTPYAGQTSSAFLQRDPVNATTKACPASTGATSPRLMKYSVSGAVADLSPMPASYLGANMPYNVDWSPTPVYTDLVRQARCFGTKEAPWGECSVPVGADGWPTGDFGVFLMTGPWLYGTYKLSFTGKADVGLNGTGNTVLANKVYDATKNRTTIDVVRQPGAQHMALTFSNTGSGIKDLKVMRPGYDPDTAPLYTREFLDHIARFRVLRFMEWLDTNTTQVQTWSQRTTRTTRYATATNAHTGEPWENIIELANVSGGKDIWINIPVRADDDYVRQLATLLKGTLNASSKIYVEYSNEVWNGSFVQWGINRDLATAEVNANPVSPLAWDGSKDTTVLAMRRVGKRLKEISDIFRGVFGDADMMTRVRPVLAGQVVQPAVNAYALDVVDTVYGPPSRYFYAIAGAPYFNLGAKQTVDGLSVDDVLAAMTASIGTMSKDAALEKNIAQSRWYGLPLLAYEGGADTFGTGSLAAKKAASLDARMTGLCASYLANWYAAGGETMMWFTAGASNYDTQYGTWGLTNDLALTTAPKIKCMDQVLATPLPVARGRNTVPGTFNGQAYVGGKEAPYPAAWDNSTRYLHPGSYLDYVLVAPASGTYSLSLNTDAAQTGNKLDVSVNGKLVASMFELKNTGWNQPADNTPIAVTLNKGFNVVRVRTRTETSGFTLYALTVR
jgi:hypothetical protein